eukprot:m51a1_g1125 hypothetical protein (527) ;mRNA; f:190659-192773
MPGACGLVLGRFWRHCLASFVQNFSGFYYWTLMPLIAAEMGATASQLALMSAVNSIIYCVLCVLCGVWKLRAYNSGWVLRVAVAFFLVSCCVAMLGNAMWLFYVSSVFMAISRGIYWTIIQTTVGLEAPPERKTFFLSIFSSSWSIGKSIGFVFGGFLKGALGIMWSWVFVLGFAATQMLFLPGVFPCTSRALVSPPVPKGDELPEDPDQIDPEALDAPEEGPGSAINSDPPLVAEKTCWGSLRAWLRRMLLEDPPLADPVADHDRSMIYVVQCWLMNFYMNGMTSAIVSQFLKLALHYNIAFTHEHGHGHGQAADVSSASSASSEAAAGDKSAVETFIGVFLCCLFVWQTALFFMLCRLRLSRRRLLLYFAQGLAAGGLMLISVIRDAVTLIFACCLCGFGGGFGILLGLSASLRLSGTAVGINEAILALGGSVMPLVAGAASDLLDDPRAAYWSTAIFAVLVIAAQELVEYVGPCVLRAQRRRAAKKKEAGDEAEYVLLETMTKHKRKPCADPDMARLAALIGS